MHLSLYKYIIIPSRPLHIYLNGTGSIQHLSLREHKNLRSRKLVKHNWTELIAHHVSSITKHMCQEPANCVKERERTRENTD